MPEMRKKLITEIDRFKELMGLENLNESVIFENFIYPSNGKKVKITSPYGMRTISGRKPAMHYGLDLGAEQGTPILAIADGVVSDIEFRQNNCGGTLKVDHGIIDGKKFHSRFCHVSEFFVDKGDSVKQGQMIAKSGGKVGTKGAGNSTAPHIHFEIGLNGSAVNPKSYYDEMDEWTGKPAESGKSSTNDSFADEGGFNFGSDYDKGDTFNLEGSFTEKAKEKGSDVIDWAKDKYDDLSGKYSDWKGNTKFAGLSGIQKTFADALRKLTNF